MQPIVDMHAHVVPLVDDGATSLRESLAMLRLSASQGVTDVFCTSHSGYRIRDGERYREQFWRLQKAVLAERIRISLHTGCEILTELRYSKELFNGIDKKIFDTLDNSRYPLIEFYSDIAPDEALSIVQRIVARGYHPVLAHPERNENLSVDTAERLILAGALLQVNAYSFVEEPDLAIRERARKLLQRGCVHFIGSDAHRLSHRPPRLSAGAAYVLRNTDKTTAENILFGNAQNLLHV